MATTQKINIDIDISIQSTEEKMQRTDLRKILAEMEKGLGGLKGTLFSGRKVRDLLAKACLQIQTLVSFVQINTRMFHTTSTFKDAFRESKK